MSTSLTVGKMRELIKDMDDNDYVNVVIDNSKTGKCTYGSELRSDTYVQKKEDHDSDVDTLMIALEFGSSS